MTSAASVLGEPGPIYNWYTVGFFIVFLITISSILNAIGIDLQKLGLDKQSKSAAGAAWTPSRLLWTLLFLPEEVTVFLGCYPPMPAGGAHHESGCTANAGHGETRAGCHTDVYLYYFIVPYLDAHVLSPPSWRYAYIFWLFIPAVLVLWTLAYQLHRHPPPRTPGPPHQPRWNFHPVRWARGLLIRRLIPTTTSLSTTRSTYAPLARRARVGQDPPPPQAAHAPHARRLLPRAPASDLNPNGWAPFTDPLLSAPNVDVPRTMWTLSSRFGLLAYAMIPLVVSIGLKSWPFNIFAAPWLTHYGFDRTSIFHRWTGRLVWLWSTIHTLTFALQLSRDINPYGHTLLTDVWQYYRFNWGVVAYVALTITVCFSFNPLRNRYYEFFYCSHVVLSILFLVGCVIHYEPLWAWSVIGLVLWGAERACRLAIWLWFNGFFASPTRFWSNHATTPAHSKPYQDDAKSPAHPPEAFSNSHHSYPPSSWLPPSPGRTSFLPSSYEEGSLNIPPKSSAASAQIPPGFALVQVLPGQTLRITHRMVKDSKWDIGQYLLLCVPSVSWWQTHPYTICSSSSLSQFDSCSQGSPGKEVVLLLRARQGFSKQFYESIIRAKADRLQNDDNTQPTNGILTRCQISRPLGSSGRVAWDSLDSLVIVCGGSGISFGIAALEETCFKMCTRSHAKARKDISKSNISRVRLVWIFREYAHLTWVAPALKRCLAMVSSEELQLDLYPAKLPHQLEHAPDHPTSPWKDELMREMGIDLAPRELLALEELSERVKTGRPRLAKILDQEVDRSPGKTLIACCGPESLNGFMRALVGRQHLRLVDQHAGHKEVDIYTEDFSY
ncbi:hypothetical protein PtA15_10A542 [Puccinia triticina]|uniref:FAD-binding FR-type domain-containing protein n=1 Tax=Puccinia triticina TaxID=208348 RepID=A0ABY7CW14_9BASI|nr:uncharacterized protein PtA15_10A542 [Puccinia triticina]WAQ89118.1 hypothetical protein PtA15_10A542 [Puccinia triticina]